MKAPHLHLVPPPAHVEVTEPPQPPPWWEAPEFRALAEVRKAMVGGEVPSRPPETAEESARYAVFWALFEVEHIVRELVKGVQAGDRVLLRSSVYTHQVGRVDFSLRIIEHIEVIPPGGGR